MSELAGDAIAPGKIISYLTGFHGARDLTAQLVVRMQRGAQKVVLIDAGNCFHPYLFRRHGLTKGELYGALENILISRPFTIHQLRSVTDSGLKTVLAESASTSLLIPMLTSMFYDEDLRDDEALAVFRAILSNVVSVTKERSLATVVTAEPNAFFARRSEMLVGELEEVGKVMRWGGQSRASGT